MPERQQLAEEMKRYAEAAAERAGSSVVIKPDHRLPFVWPPPAISSKFHVLASDWKGKATIEADGITYDVEVATTPYGVFGRCPKLWHEAQGSDEKAMLRALLKSAETLFSRQRCIAYCLGLPTRFTGHLRDLQPLDLLKLLYCQDRDVANEARTEIETHASLGVFGPSLVEILRDRVHPNRRSAQWCVLDLFEDLRSFCDTPEVEGNAIAAMRNLLWDAEDDYARTVFKAGVVLGGQLPAEKGGPVLIECLHAPSKIGRRAAIHGLFHVVEWDAGTEGTVLSALNELAQNDPEPVLRHYAAAMATDIQAGNLDHVAEPTFADEP